MKFQFVLIALLLSASSAFAQCDLTAVENPALEKLMPHFSNREKADLTPYWAQEYVGSDLARKFIQEYSGNLPESIGFALIDAIMKDHHTAVSNLVNHESMIGASQRGKKLVSDIFPSELAAEWKTDGEEPAFVRVLDQLSDLGPGVVNVSRGIDDTPAIRQGLSLLSRTALICVSAGNDYPEQMETIFNKNDNLIAVGSSSPVGLISYFSQEGNAVTVLAPAGSFALSFRAEYGNTPAYVAFGGTSAATPEVCGSLINAKLFLGNLTTQNAKQLLRKTSTPLFHNVMGDRKNGAGMLNHYKLVRVAARLSERGIDGAKSEAFADEKIYDFKSEASALLIEGKKNLSAIDCETKKSGLLALRKSFLLEPTSESAQLLASLYRQQGREVNAVFYAGLTDKGRSQTMKWSLNHEGYDFQDDAVRTRKSIRK